MLGLKNPLILSKDYVHLYTQFLPPFMAGWAMRNVNLRQIIAHKFP